MTVLDEMKRVCDERPEIVTRRANVLYEKNQICGYCNLRITTRAEADLVDEATGPEYLIHRTCFSAWLCSLLNRSKIGRRGSLRLMR